MGTSQNWKFMKSRKCLVRVCHLLRYMMKLIHARKCAIQPARHWKRHGVRRDGVTNANVVPTRISEIQLKKLKKYFHP